MCLGISSEESPVWEEKRRNGAQGFLLGKQREEPVCRMQARSQ